MKHRYHMEGKDGSFIETAMTFEGLRQIQAHRKANIQYYRKRIKHVIQARPDEVPLNTIIKLEDR